MFIEIDTEYSNTIINANHIVEIYMDDPEYFDNGLVVDRINIKLTNGRVYTLVYRDKDENACFIESMGFFDILRKMLKPLKEEDFF